MRRLLVVIDYQNDSVSGSLGFPKAKTLEDAIIKKIETYKTYEGNILFTFDTHFNEHIEKEVSYGWELYGKINDIKTPDMKTISKHTYGSLDLSDYLLQEEFDIIEFVGVMTNVCVLSNVIIAKSTLPEAKIVVDGACVASNDDILHEKALDIMEALNVQVINRSR